MSRVPSIIDRPDGVITGVNLKRISEMPYFMLPNQPQNQLVIPAGQSLQQIPITISGEGPAQVHEFVCERELSNSAGQAVDGGNYPFVSGTPSSPQSILTPPISGFSPTSINVATVFMQIQDGQGMSPLMNGACHIDTIFGNYNFFSGPFGSATSPYTRGYPLPEALYLDEQRKLLISATDLANPVPISPSTTPVTNNIRPVLIAQRMLTRIFDTDTKQARAKMDKRQYLTMPFFYVLDNGFSNVQANATNTETISIGQTAHFELFQLTAVATYGLGSFLINIADQDTGESIFDAPLGVSFPLSSGLVVGNASFPVRLHEPRFFEIGSKLVVTLTDISGNPNSYVNGNTIYLTLGGRNVADRMWS